MNIRIYGYLWIFFVIIYSTPNVFDNSLQFTASAFSVQPRITPIAEP